MIVLVLFVVKHCHWCQHIPCNTAHYMMESELHGACPYFRFARYEVVRHGTNVTRLNHPAQRHTLGDRKISFSVFSLIEFMLVDHDFDLLPQLWDDACSHKQRNDARCICLVDLLASKRMKGCGLFEEVDFQTSSETPFPRIPTN